MFRRQHVHDRYSLERVESSSDPKGPVRRSPTISGRREFALIQPCRASRHEVTTSVTSLARMLSPHNVNFIGVFATKCTNVTQMTAFDGGTDSASCITEFLG
jgi:hypothetical protein